MLNNVIQSMNMYIGNFLSWLNERTSSFNLPYFALLYFKKHRSKIFFKNGFEKKPRGYDIKLT